MHLLIVDGYNVIHALPKFRRHLERKLSAARAELVRELGRLAGAKKGNVEIHVFFDGQPQEGYWGDSEPLVAGVETHFAEGNDADEAIIEYLEDLPGCGNVTVVTDDRGLGFRARDIGANVISGAELDNRFRKI